MGSDRRYNTHGQETIPGRLSMEGIYGRIEHKQSRDCIWDYTIER